MAFNNNFVWGAATSSYQIEGAATTDGRGLSIWDVFSHTPGKVFGNHTGDTTVDHYDRMEQDVALMQQMGLQAYRFSISWPRILPEGVGKVNELGISFYDRLVDQLLNAEITPYVTLYHWDLPYALYQQGGWLNRAIGDWFANYADIISKSLGDRVKHWITLNEPSVFINLGHVYGKHAPGYSHPAGDILRMIHHTLLAHGRAVQVLRANVPDGQVGVTLTTQPTIPVGNSDAEVEAGARLLFEDSVQAASFWSDVLWGDPIVKGDYPQEVYDYYTMPDFPREDLAIIAQPLDFMGLNIYYGRPVKLENAKAISMTDTENTPRTRFNWPVRPESLYWGPRYFYERYGLPIYITENGLSSMDWMTVDGTVPDHMRIDFTRRYLRELRRAVADNVDVRGYFHWSLMDNFEWEEGYNQRFGMIYVNFETKERTLKESAKWYATVIQANGENL